MPNQTPFLQAEDVLHKDGFYVSHTLVGATAQTDANYGIFFTAYWPCEVLWVGVRYATNNGAALTLQLVKVPDATAVASGSSMLATAFNLNTTADTIQTRSGLTLLRAGTTQLDTNEALGIVKTGTLTSIAHLTLTVYLKMLGRGDYK